MCDISIVDDYVLENDTVRYKAGVPEEDNECVTGTHKKWEEPEITEALLL